MGLRGIAARIAGAAMAPVRGLARGRLRRRLARESTPLSPKELSGSALFFAPHPDDETLGCGGTIALKRRRGAEVTVAFVTDGAASDPGADPQALARQRRQEALAACLILGVDARHVRWLGFPDGRLSANAEAATAAAMALLEEARADQVFIPYGVGEHPDHAAAGRIVVAALAKCGRAPAVFEYPIWFWRHWPWVGIGGREAASLFGASRRASFGGKLRREFTRRVGIAETLEQKRLALREHGTQEANLSEVSGGDFLKCFFSGDEWFREVSV